VEIEAEAELLPR